MNFFGKLKFGILLLLLASCIKITAQAGEEEFANLNYSGDVRKTGTSAAAFLEIGVGARAQAMGAAYVALSNDVSAIYWNPAGISRSQSVSASANHTQWFAGTSLQYFGLAIPFSSDVAIGFGVTALDYGDKQPVRTILQPEGTGEYYDASDIALSASYSMKLTENFSFGATAKYIKQTIWHESAQAFALDLGILYNTELKGLNIGASISNFGTDLKLEGRDLVRAFDADEQNYSNDKLNVYLQTDEFTLPLIFRFGLAYNYEISKDYNITIASDLIHPSNNVVYMNSGMEVSLLNVISLRAGYESLFDDSSEKGLNVGFGLQNPYSEVLDFTINYSYSSFGVLGETQRVSFDLKL